MVKYSVGVKKVMDPLKILIYCLTRELLFLTANLENRFNMESLVLISDFTPMTKLTLLSQKDAQRLSALQASSTLLLRVTTMVNYGAQQQIIDLIYS